MEINSFIQKLFERASEAGYEAAEAYYSTGEQFDVSVKGGEIVDYNVSSSMGLSFRALIGGKMGKSFGSTGSAFGDPVHLFWNPRRPTPNRKPPADPAPNLRLSGA